jgi:hypothetical protein
MLATAVVISLGAGAGSALTMQPAGGDAKAMSFAKSFDALDLSTALQGAMKPDRILQPVVAGGKFRALNVADYIVSGNGQHPAGTPAREEVFKKGEMDVPAVAPADSNASIGNSHLSDHAEDVSIADSRKASDAHVLALKHLRKGKAENDVSAMSNLPLAVEKKIVVESQSDPLPLASRSVKAEEVPPMRPDAKTASPRLSQVEITARLETSKPPAGDCKAQIGQPVRKEAKYKEGTAGLVDVEKKTMAPATIVVPVVPAPMATPANIGVPVRTQRDDMYEPLDSSSRPAARGLRPAGFTSMISGTAGEVRASRPHVESNSAKNIVAVAPAASVRPHHTNFPSVSTTQDEGASQLRSKVSDLGKAERISTQRIDVNGTTHRTSAPVVAPTVHAGVEEAAPVARVESVARVQMAEVRSPTSREWDVASRTEAGMMGSEVHKTLLATQTTLEIDVPNGMHGWLKIRAEMTDGGDVKASLSATSTAGQQMLHRELPSLTAFLQSERVGNAVAVAVTESATSTRDYGGSMPGGDAREQSPDSNRQGGNGRHGMANQASDEAMSYDWKSLASGAEWLSPVVYSSGGSWLSVRA